MSPATLFLVLYTAGYWTVAVGIAVAIVWWDGRPE